MEEKERGEPCSAFAEAAVLSSCTRSSRRLAGHPIESCKPPGVEWGKFKLDNLEYRAVSHEHQSFLQKALERKGFGEAYHKLSDEYKLVRELLAARARAGLTQEDVAKEMGTTKSAVSRLESAGRHSPSVATLKRYARAVGCNIEIRLRPTRSPKER